MAFFKYIMHFEQGTILATNKLIIFSILFAFYEKHNRPSSAYFRDE